MRILTPLMVAAAISTSLVLAQDASTTVRLADRTDWWSVLNEDFYWPIEKPTGDELSSDNFEIAGLNIQNDPSFRVVQEKFGRAIPAARGNVESGRHQICYVSEQHPPVRLIFETGESNLTFYLFEGGQPWNGQALCAPSSRVSSELRTKGGLGLGISPSDVEKILGKADVANATRLVYQREVDRRTPDDKLADLRKEHADMAEKDFHDNYDSYQLELYIETRFTDGKLTYLAVSKGESY